MAKEVEEKLGRSEVLQRKVQKKQKDNMKSVQLLFPHQLFENLDQLDRNLEVLLIEEWLFFKQYPFHKQKVVFHRATMKHYERYLMENDFSVTYVEAMEKISDIRLLIDSLEGINTVTYYDTVDSWLEKRIASSLERNNIEGNRITMVPNFINKGGSIWNTVGN